MSDYETLLGLRSRRSRFTRIRGAVIASRLLSPVDGWQRIETKKFPPNTVGSTEYPHGVRYVRATVPFDWKPEWRK